ncbi:MAG: CxxC-x17-CxxC domain-containing protein [Candidatus Paceibacterota bacterium]
MGKFNRGGDRGSFGGNRGRGSSFGGGREFRRNDSGGSRFGGGDREMFDVVCDECKKNCKVPFRPSSDKPVYCSECFSKRGGSARSGSDFPRRDFNDRPQRFESSFSSPRMQDDGVKKQLEAISAKLDTLIKAFAPVSKTASVETKVESKKAPVVVEVKTEAKKASKSKAKVAPKKKTSKK